MKVLFVTNRCPWPAINGGRLRSARLIEQLSKHHNVQTVILDTAPGDATPMPTSAIFRPLLDEEFRAKSNGWRSKLTTLRSMFDHRPDLVRTCHTVKSPLAFDTIKQLAEKSDVLWIEWPYIAVQALDVGIRTKIVVDYIDISAVVQSSTLASIPWSLYRVAKMIDTVKLRRLERDVSRRAWRSVVCKPEDKQILGGQNVFVVPNGTDVAPDLSEQPAETDQLLFVGLMCYEPNVDAANWFVRECRPAIEKQLNRPIRFDVVGAQPRPEVEALDDGDRVRVQGFAQSLVEWYRRATVVVAPIRQGSGTKLKVLEALAYGKPLVATTEAVRGHGLRPGVDFLLANSPVEFADACGRLLNDPELRRRLGQTGRERVMNYHTWDKVGEIADRVVRD